MSNKVLKILFTILFVVFLGEVGYFLYSSRGQYQSNLSTNIKVEKIPTPTIRERNGKQAVDDETVEEMKNYNAGVLKKSFLENSSSGKIVEISTNGVNPNNNIHFAVKIKLIGDNNETNIFYFNDNEIKMILIHKSSDPTNKNPLTVNDLKEGDTITINEVLDMTKDPDHNLVSNTILIQ